MESFDSILQKNLAPRSRRAYGDKWKHFDTHCAEYYPGIVDEEG